jgi:2-polyprenyl-3-methyl-5-hydroxy-6-metoxy-1,4-benzoquinol methylase
VIAAEVIEHVHTAPELVFRFLATLLRPGGRLIVQTPNAAALPHRIELLFGRNPFERIRLDPNDPGHYREYTVDELLAIGRGAGLAVTDWTVQNYFAPVRPFARMYARVAPFLPSRLRAGITVSYRKS